MNATRHKWLAGRYVLPVGFVVLCLSDVVFAFGFHAFIDRGRGLYGSTVFTILVAMIALFGAFGWLLSASLRDVDVTSSAPSGSARVSKPTLFFLVVITLMYGAMDIWFWVNDRSMPDLPNIGIQFLWIANFAAQYAYDRRRWRQSVAEQALRTQEPPDAYAGPGFMFAILITMYLSHPHVFPPWMLVLIVLFAVALGVGVTRALLNQRTPTGT